MMVFEHKEWLPVAGVLAQYWEGMGGPYESPTKSKLLAAGVRYRDLPGKNRQDRVEAAVLQANGQEEARKTVSALVGLLREGGHLRERPTGLLNELQNALADVGGSLSDQGSLQWLDSEHLERSRVPTGHPAPFSRAASASSNLIGSRTSASQAPVDEMDSLAAMLRRVPLASPPLIDSRKRHGGRDVFTIWDEYDVQAFIQFVLSLHYDDVRAEEYMPSFAGNASRVDFLVKQAALLVEAKVAYAGHGERKIMAEISEDLIRYSTREGLRELLIVVYDLDGTIRNSHGFEADIQGVQVGSLRVRAVVTLWPNTQRSPAHAQ